MCKSAHFQAGTVGGVVKMSGCGGIRAHVARPLKFPSIPPSTDLCPFVPSGSPGGDAVVHPTRGLGERGGAHWQGAEGAAAPPGGNGTQGKGVLLPER